ncbi:MAG: hypothetical protein WAN43_05480 [Rhodomicrobium sp.]
MSLKHLRERIGAQTKISGRNPLATATLATKSLDAQKFVANVAKLQRQEPEIVAKDANVANISPRLAATPKTDFVANVAVATAWSPENSCPPIDLSAFHERAAIMECDGGLSRFEAENAAAIELGFETAQALYRAIIDAWLAEVAAAPETKLHGFDRLKDESLRFLVSDWALKALAAGWDDLGLFAVHENAAPRERLDAWGLATLLSWGVLKSSIVRFERDFCLLRTSGGSELRQSRMRANFDAALVWWAHPLLKPHSERTAHAI